MEKIKKSLARRNIVNCQGFCSRFNEQEKGVLEVINHLGYVQIDTLNVINRAHEHIIFSRQPGYKGKYLGYMILAKGFILSQTKLKHLHQKRQLFFRSENH